MACCAALALVLGLVRGAWFRVVPGRRPAEPGFAPPARRSADGTAPPSTRPAAPASRRPALAGSLLVGTAYGAGAYALTVAVLLGTPVARTLDGPWTGRDVALVALAAVALAIGLARGGPIVRPAVLLGAAATWTELGLVDMHLLGLFDFRVAALPFDLLLHGSGPLVMVLAARRLALPRPTLETSPA